MNRLFGIALSLCFLFFSFPLTAQELVEITSDDIILNEPDFSQYIEKKVPYLKEELLNLNKEMVVQHLKVEVKDFAQFSRSVKDYFFRKKISRKKLEELEKEILVIRGKVLDQESLSSPKAVKLVLEYKLIQKNIEHAHNSLEVLEQDFRIMFDVLKNGAISSTHNNVTDLVSYAGVMVNELGTLKAKGKEYFDTYEKISEQDIENIENAEILQAQFLRIGIESVGVFHLATETDHFLDSLGDWFGAVYNYELYIMENKRITLASLVGTLISMLTLFVIYYVANKLIRTSLGDQGIAFAVATLSKYAFILIIFVVFLGGIGLDLGKITVLVSALSVGIGFGLTTLVSNFIAGIIILIEGSISKGDRLRVGDLGLVEVIAVGIRKSILRTLDDEDVVVPNTELVSKDIINLTYKGRTVNRHRIQFSINPFVDMELMKRVAIASCIETLGGEAALVGKTPFVRIKDLDHSNLVCELVFYMDYAKGFIPDQTFKTNLLEHFFKAGLDIFMAPVSSIEIVKGEEALNPNIELFRRKS